MFRPTRSPSHPHQKACRSNLSTKLALAMLAVSTLLTALPSSAMLKSSPTELGATPGVMSPKETAAENADEIPDTPHRVYAPHWSTEDGLATTIYIRNVQIKKAITARLSLILEHRTFTLAPTRIDALQTVGVDLAQALACNGETIEQSGGALIDFEAESTGAVNAYAQVLDTKRSLGFSFPFMPDGSTVGSQTAEAVAWYYSRNTDGFVALQNTTKQTAKVTLKMFVSGQAVSLGKRHLKPQQVVTIKLPSPASLGHGNDVQNAGLRVEYSGSPGTVVAQGWMVDGQIGFSFPFAFHYPSNCNCSGDVQHLYGTGIMIGAAMSASSDVGPIFSPYFIARNRSDQPLTITPIFSYTVQDHTEKVSLPSLILNTQENAVVNLRKYQEDGTIPMWVTAGNIDLQYQGESGALVAEMASVDQDGTFVPPVPLVCNGNRALHMSFWRTDGDWHSSVTLQNIATEENDVEITISYPGGLYLLEKTIPAGEAVMVSINELQQSQTPDREGRRIPAEVTSGGLNIWSHNVNNGLVMNAMTMNPVTKTCGSCGGTGYVTSYSLTDTFGCTSGFRTYTVGESVSLMMSIHWSTSACSYENPQLNSSSNTSVVNMSLLTVGVGSTSLQATSYQSYPRDVSCSSYYHLTSNGSVQAVCAVPTNFHQVGSATDNGGVLHFEYAWASSTGNLAQLSQCTVGEIVTYPSGNPYTWPNPPFSGSSTNPTIINLPATTGNFGDDHTHPSFVTPYQTSAFTATQYYRYRCPCSNGGDYVNVLGPLNITRAVNQNGDGTWRYTVTKSGSTASVNPLP